MKNMQQWDMKISECKRFFIKRYGTGSIKVRGEPFYRKSIMKYKVVTKKGVNINAFNPEIIQKYHVKVSYEKI